MNTDIGELLKRAKIRDPISAGAIASLVVAMVLFVLVVSSWLGAVQEQKGAEVEYAAAQDSIEQIQRVQESSPEVLQTRIEEAKQQLRSLLADFPTDQQALAELSRYYEYASAFNAELVRMEAVLPSNETEAEDAYIVDRFLLEVRGSFPDLLRFLGHVTSGPYRTFAFDDVVISSDMQSLADINLAAFYSSLAPGVAPISPTEKIGLTTPAPLASGLADISKLEVSLRRALREKNWTVAIALGQRILEQDPEREDIARALHEAYVSWGRSLVSRGKRDESGAQLLPTLSLVPENEPSPSVIRDLKETTAAQVPMPTKTSIGAAPTRTVVGETVYVVRHGDSLWLIARRYKTTVAEIVRVNDLRNTNIYVGQKLIVPGQ